MKKSIDFSVRRASPDDYQFAEKICMDAMRSLMRELGCWKPRIRKAAFRRAYKMSDARIVLHKGQVIGWFQLTERDTDFNLAQIQILKNFRGIGLGTQVLQRLVQKADTKGKSISLSATSNNRALNLYRRMGFKLVEPDASPIVDMVRKPRRI